MTPSTDHNEVYTIRGHEISLDYDSDDHVATVQCGALDAHAEDLGAALEDIGVYTRVQDVRDRRDGQVTFAIKPASGLELRDENGTLRKRPVSNPTNASAISKQRDSYRYSATVPVDHLNEIGIDKKGQVAFYLSVEDGKLAFRVEPDEDAPHGVMARVETGGLVRIPSVVGAAGDLDGHAVKWETTEDGTLSGVTTLELEDLDTSEDEQSRHAIVGVAQKSQEVTPSTGEYEGRTWTQEHFQTYIRSEHASALDWEAKDLVDMRFARSGDTLLLVLDSTVRDEYDEDTPCVKRLSAYAKSKGDEEGHQLNFYLPNALVYAMRVDVSETIRWTVIDSCLAGWRP